MNHHALFAAASHAATHASAKASSVRHSVLRRLRMLVPPGRQRERLLVIAATGLVLIASMGTFATHVVG